MGAYTPGQAKELPLRDFGPDLPIDTPGIILDAVGAQPTLSGFRPLPNPTNIGDALEARPLGSYLAYYSDETTQLFAATAARLWYLNGTTWENAGTFPSALSYVRFTQFGDDVLCVGSGSGADKKILIAANKATSFSVISGSPADPTVIVGMEGQVLAFAGQNWFSSAAGDDADWAADVATLAATGILYGAPGPIVGGAAIYDNALAFKKNSIFLGRQSGPPHSWEWEPISRQVGTWGQGCIIAGPGWVDFLGVDDFYTTTGYAPERIPNNLKDWFFRKVNPTYLPNTQGWYDASQGTSYWHFVSNDAALPPTCDMFVSYNRRAKRWCVGYLDVSSVPYLGTASVQLPLHTSANATILIDGSFAPNRLFTGGVGTAMALLTGYYGDPGRVSQLMRVRPKYNTRPDVEVVTPFYTGILGEEDTSPGAAILGNDGWHYTRQTGRYHRMRLATQGNCEVTALAAELREAGVR